MESNTENLIDTLPFDINQFRLQQYRFKERDFIEQNSHNPKKIERIKLFFRLIECGLSLGNGFIAVRPGDNGGNIPYQVSKMDFNFFEIGAVRWDLTQKDRHINLVSEINNSRIDGIIGHLKTEMINK